MLILYIFLKSTIEGEKLTFNGFDLLFVLIGISLSFGITEIYILFKRWRQWDYRRRRWRKLYLYRVRDQMNEKAYRQELQSLIRPGFIRDMHMLARAFEKISEVFVGTKTV